MANRIQVKRGTKTSLPTLNVGEFGFCTDTKELYIGSDAGNKRVDATAEVATQSANGLMSAGDKKKLDGIETGTNRTPLDIFTWAQISEITAMGNAIKYWRIGDEKDIMLTSGEVLTLQIYDFSHDDLTAGGKAGITFGLKNLMTANRRMNQTDTNYYSFTDCEIYAWLNGGLYNSLPSDLRGLIKAVNKRTAAQYRDSEIVAESMKVFLFSEVECLGFVGGSFEGEGIKYPIFTNEASRSKRLANGGYPYPNDWWLRSPYRNDSSSFCYFDSNGSYSGDSVTSGYGVCFGFCI